MKYRHLFFDLDKTLWDYDANSSRALTGIFHEFNLKRHYTSAEEFLDIYNHHNDQLWESYRNGEIQKAELRTKRFALTLGEKKVYDNDLAYEVGEKYMDITPRLNILAPNTIELLEYLQTKDYQLYILTNGFISTQEKKMKNSNLTQYFRRVFSSEEIGINKPSKKIFHWAVSSIHASKDHCLMIGDDLDVDIKGALNYGIDAAWYNPENSASETKATYTVQDLGMLMSIL